MSIRFVKKQRTKNHIEQIEALLIGLNRQTSLVYEKNQNHTRNHIPVISEKSTQDNLEINHLTMLDFSEKTLTISGIFEQLKLKIHNFKNDEFLNEEIQKLTNSVFLKVKQI